MINTIRHVTIFDPSQFNKKIDVIGCGAIGSYVARSLSKLGINPWVKLWDFDTVESHNLANQAFDERSISGYKAAWLGHYAATDGNAWEYRQEKYEGQEALGDVVFLCVDSMEQRSKIFDENIRFHSNVKLVIDCRIDPFAYRIYTLKPSDIEHVEMWDNNMYEDTEQNLSQCGTKQTMGPTAQITANLAVMNMVRWHREEVKVFGEIIGSLNPVATYYTEV